ncbi:AfsR/SARP family transcriptional regulator [Streptomyces sp. NPDC090106]|uniref:AfsR/SARP family transcriptional regulator n=1 Tax=Streptomyces sp. NPDC090106 TaxID=3365946 RepID=UPI0038295991
MSSDRIHNLTFSVLGPLRAWTGTSELTLGTPQQQAMLAVLLLARGRCVSMDELVDGLWGDAPPTSAASVVRTYLSRLRGLLGRAAPDEKVLMSVGGGYALRVADDRLDLTVFERQVAEARGLAPAAAVARTRAALKAWAGVPLKGVPGPFAEVERTRLNELRLSVTETCIDYELEQGAHRQVVAELIALTTAHPLRERLCWQLMLALYGSDRQAEALAVFHDTRRTLSEELGVEPGPALRDLLTRILNSDPAVVAHPPGRDERSGLVRPAQLPSDLGDFTGRVSEVAAVKALLLDRAGTATPVVLLTGMGGTGKTALAVHAAHRCADRFPDGQLYVDLRGADDVPADPRDVLGQFLRALGIPKQQIPASAEERAAAYRSVLAERQVLVVLDNAQNADQVRPLLPGANGSGAVVTSRSRLLSLPATGRLAVEVFDLRTAGDLFRRVVGGARTAAAGLAVLRVVELCGGLPLAVRIIASRVAVHPEWPIPDVLERLLDERRRLRELRVEELTVESCFHLSYRRLGPEQAHSLRTLSLLELPVIELGEASAVLGVPEDEAEHLLDSLFSAGVLESPAPGHYRYHDLVKLFARKQAREEDGPAARSEAIAPLVDYFLATALQAYTMTRPGHTLPSRLTTTVRGLSFGNQEVALRWGSRRLTDALSVVAQAAEEYTAAAADLLLALDPVLMADHRWPDMTQIGSTLVAAARRAGDQRAELRAGYMLGGALMEMERIDEARAVTDRAIDLSLQEDDPVVQAMTLNVSAVIERERQRLDEAIAEGRRAAAVAAAIGDLSVEAMALGNVIHFRLLAGERDSEMLDTALRQLHLQDVLGDTQGRAWALFRLASVQQDLGRPAQAERTFKQALELLPEEERLLRTGITCKLARAQLELASFAEAARTAETAVSLAREIKATRMEISASRDLGDALMRLGHTEWARSVWITSHDLAVHGQCPQLETELLDRIGKDDAENGITL